MTYYPRAYPPHSLSGWETQLAAKVATWYTAEPRKLERHQTPLDKFVRDMKVIWPTDEPGYPPAFIDDMIYQLERKVMRPFMALLKEFAGSPGAGFLGGAGSRALDKGRAIFDARLLPLWNEAIDEKRAGTDFIFAPTFRSDYIQALENFSEAYGYLRDAVSDKHWLLRMGPLTDGWISLMNSTMTAFVRVADTVESAGKIAYKPLARTAEIVTGLVKITALGLAGYVAYKIFAAREEKKQ